MASASVQRRAPRERGCHASPSREEQARSPAPLPGAIHLRLETGPEQRRPSRPCSAQHRHLQPACGPAREVAVRIARRRRERSPITLHPPIPPRLSVAWTHPRGGTTNELRRLLLLVHPPPPPLFRRQVRRLSPPPLAARERTLRPRSRLRRCRDYRARRTAA